MNAIIKRLPPEALPGINTRSYRMIVQNGEIWFEHLDGIYDYTDIALEKFASDLQQIADPDFPENVAILLFDTTVSEALAQGILEGLATLQAGRLRRVAIVGVDNLKKSVFLRVMRERSISLPFSLLFHRDLERAKKWLVSEPPQKRRPNKPTKKT